VRPFAREDNTFLIIRSLTMIVFLLAMGTIVLFACDFSRARALFRTERRFMNASGVATAPQDVTQLYSEGVQIVFPITSVPRVGRTRMTRPGFVLGLPLETDASLAKPFLLRRQLDNPPGAPSTKRVKFSGASSSAAFCCRLPRQREQNLTGHPKSSSYEGPPPWYRSED